MKFEVVLKEGFSNIPSMYVKQANEKAQEAYKSLGFDWSEEVPRCLGNLFNWHASKEGVAYWALANQIFDIRLEKEPTRFEDLKVGDRFRLVEGSSVYVKLKTNGAAFDGGIPANCMDVNTFTVHFTRDLLEVVLVEQD